MDTTIAAAPMPNIEAAIQRRLLDPAFLQKLIRYALAVVICALAVISVQAIAIVLLVTHPAHVKYIYHDPFGRPRELIVTDQPFFSDAQVMNWAVDKITTLYTLDFAHCSKELDAARVNFDPAGWNSWASAFQAPGNIDFIISKRVFTTATPKSAARIEWEGISHGAYEWHVHFPMYLRWANDAGEKTDLMSVDVVIQRTNDPLHADGLVITELNVPKSQDGT